MRDEFVKTLSKISAKDQKVLLITGDLGFGVLTDFAAKYPKQYLNAGVAEQNVMGLATGLALEGRIVYAYSIGNFPTLRCLEQIRNDICYHDVNVKIVAVGGGFCYGPLGISHHATEDIAIMRSLPNMTVFAPGDVLETAAAVRATYETEGPCYLRLGRGGGPEIHDKNMRFEAGKAIRLFEGKDAILISTGGIFQNAFDARKILADKGLSVGLYSMHTVKPIDHEALRDAAKKTRLIVTIEEHSVIGGLGGAVSEILATMERPAARLSMIGLKSGFSSRVGSQEYLRSVYGMSVESIVDTVETRLK
ncbi:MAG: transketolase [Candidatus Omnitrophica bacterium]|nr:transketolase [Candidatus Omnitrophota bacterium]